MQDFEGIIRRMLTALNAKNTVHLADLIGTSQSTISTWRMRKKVPESSIGKVTKLANVSYEWLETGEGEMRPAKAGETAALNLQLVRAVVEAVLEHLEKEDKDLDPATVGDLVVTLYEEFSETKEKKVNKRTVARMIRLAK